MVSCSLLLLLPQIPTRKCPCTCTHYLMDVLSSAWPWVQPMVRQPLVSSERFWCSFGLWFLAWPISLFLAGSPLLSFFPGRFVSGLSTSSSKGFLLLKLPLSSFQPFWSWIHQRPAPTMGPGATGSSPPPKSEVSVISLESLSRTSLATMQNYLLTNLSATERLFTWAKNRVAQECIGLTWLYTMVIYFCNLGCSWKYQRKVEKMCVRKNSFTMLDLHKSKLLTSARDSVCFLFFGFSLVFWCSIKRQRNPSNFGIWWKQKVVCFSFLGASYLFICRVCVCDIML